MKYPFWVCTKHEILIGFQIGKKKKKSFENINNNNSKVSL